MTKAEALTTVAAGMPQPFTAADLTAAAWAMYPDQFALAGHPSHADSHAVMAVLCGKRGLVHRGVLKRLDGGKYQFIRKAQPAMKMVSLAAEDVERMLNSRALSNFQHGIAPSAADADGFWGSVKDRLAVRAGLARLVGDFELPSGRFVTTEAVAELRMLDSHLWKLVTKKKDKPHA